MERKQTVIQRDMRLCWFRDCLRLRLLWNWQ